eukprot:CAMPEP_0202726916 /NCGR_PEP_ID=MMETSP1385-20130828/184857_1 /ASSEMBLY_ACC=CAM_ASM_000861 /TAXON_ID=933848 /ORGANISM="Elphidium margaritaceum" /LENGTH=437 /DNA_ID=CAMNT_0049393145 /DNA_START=31 /DNA_END=1344 /DNA_ORIENTATION=-
MRRISFVISWLTAGVLCSVDYDDCQFNLTDTNGITAEYDLYHFHLTGYSAFEVKDSREDPDHPYTYFFNICGAINPQLFVADQLIPKECAHPLEQHGPCLDMTETQECVGGYAKTTDEIPSAVQVWKDGNATRCVWLGMEVDTDAYNLPDSWPEYRKELLDPDDAGKGIIFTILNGQWCGHKNREMRIKLKCADDPRIEFSPNTMQQYISSQLLEEPDTCTYEVVYETPLACPNKCVSTITSSMYSVCGTHGICEADPYGLGPDAYPNGTIRCLCDDGYTGDFCEELSIGVTFIDQKHPGLLAVIIVCIILLGAAIVCAAVLCHKIRTKELEDAGALHHFSGGMLQDDADANLARTKVNAMSMNIGGVADDNAGRTATETLVQLQTVDDQLESDKQKNELLDEDESIEEQASAPQDENVDDDNQEQEEQQTETQADA